MLFARYGPKAVAHAAEGRKKKLGLTNQPAVCAAEDRCAAPETL
jgi:hypothetical protein